MTYVISELCTREGDCVEVCPVDCIVPGRKGDPDHADWPLFYIDPDNCIDCGACVPVCPPEAIFMEDELPPDQEHMLETNANFFKEGVGPGYWDFDLEEQRGLPNAG